METICDRIGEILREMDGPERGKQSRLAGIAECSRGLISQLLTNPGQQLGYDYAKNIEKRMGWRVDWVLNGYLPKRISEKESVNVEGGSADEVIELAILYRQATPDARMRILDFARSAEKLPGTVRLLPDFHY